MVAAAPPSFDLYADFRSVPLIGESLGGNNWTDTRLFAFSPAGYERYLYGCKEDDDWVIEKTIFSRLRPQLASDPRIVPRFKRQPIFQGVCAGTGQDYGDVGSKAKNMVRAVARRVAPSLWL
jgi:hypothetical protein